MRVYDFEVFYILAFQVLFILIRELNEIFKELIFALREVPFGIFQVALILIWVKSLVIHNEPLRRCVFVISIEILQNKPLFIFQDALEIEHDGKIVLAATLLGMDMTHDKIDGERCSVVQSMGQHVLEVEIHGIEELTFIHDQAYLLHFCGYRP